MEEILIELVQEFLPSSKVLLGGILGVLVGAAITIWRTRYASRSADLTARVNEVCEIVDQLSDSSARAATGIGADSDALRSSKSYCLAMQARLDELIESLERDFAGFWNADLKDCYLRFSQASTGGEFESFKTAPESHVRAVIVTGGRLKDRLRSSRSLAH